MTKLRIPKKLIEVALPLDDINVACVREKSIRHGHPSTLHLWWAPRPLAAARAIIFAQMVNDPGFENGNGFQRGFKKDIAERKREELFQIIRDLVKWESINNQEILNRARAAIRESWIETCELNKHHPDASELFDPEKLPAFHDPFAGGGALPLEAQRLGLEAHASDLNPVAVIKNKALIEIPPNFTGSIPIGPIPVAEKNVKLINDWSGSKGLAEDVRRYGHLTRQLVEKKIGELYPRVKITEAAVKLRPDLAQFVGQELTVIAWIWARTVKSPSPAFSHIDVPLASTFVLSSKLGKETYIQPIIEGDNYRFEIRFKESNSDAELGTSAGKRAAFKCLLSGAPITYNYLKEEGKRKKIGKRLMAIVAEGKNGRVYLSPEFQDEVKVQFTGERPLTPLEGKCRVNVTPYGFETYGDLFTDRQLIALTTFSNTISEVKELAIKDAILRGVSSDTTPLSLGGAGATAYAEAIQFYLGLAVGKASDYNSQISTWINGGETLRSTFGKQAIPMVWDFSEANIIGTGTGSYQSGINQIVRVLGNINSNINGYASQENASNQSLSLNKVISTDPPYYDNIQYADLSDFFYVWMRKSLRDIFPDLFKTLAVPKHEELVANQARQGGKQAAEDFFLNGMTLAMRNIADQGHRAFPVTIYYAFKQSETSEGSTSSAGWETFLEAVIKAGFSIDGTWPIRTERENRSISIGKNSLASSIVLVCQKRPQNADTISRRDFARELREQMPLALETMIGGETGASPIAPVDLAQSAIGPGMAIYSKYSAVLNQDGTHMSVHDALVMINREISEFLNPDAGNFDADTLFCSSWFDQFGFGTGKYGDAETLATAKGTTVKGVETAGVIQSGGGNVRLLKYDEYPDDWKPEQDERTPIWEACHHLIRVLNKQSTYEAGQLLARMPQKGEVIRQLAYHLYTLCERKKWAEEARAYNELIGAWPEIMASSLDIGHKHTQTQMNLI
jgi:putative DNA methylase